MSLGRTALAKQYVREARRRMEKGLLTYGDFDPKTDDRILTKEAIEESIDAYNYLFMLKVKHPSLVEDVADCHRAAFALYCKLLKLEEKEESLTLKRGGDLRSL